MEKKKVLIVDDEEDFAVMVKLNLEATGRYEVRTENKGLLAVVTAKEFKPDLILLDIIMPDIEGSQVAASLKGDRDTAKIPVVFLTAMVTKEETESAGGVIAGNPFIAKPVDTKSLIDCIEKNISKE